MYFVLMSDSPAQPNRYLQTIKILLVDDSSIHSMFVRSVLSANAPLSEIKSAVSLKEAWLQLDAINFDVILLDLFLPDSKGMESVLRVVERTGGTVPIIVLTALEEEAVGLEAIQNGAQDYLTKGKFDPRLLLTVIRHAIERKKLSNQLQEALSNIKTLKGLIPICYGCKKIRDDNGFWERLETYIKNRSEAEFSHGLCPDCFQTESAKYKVKK